LEYDQGQVEKLNELYKRKYGGVENYMKVIFSRNPMQWIKMGYSVVDMNVIESMKYTLQDICNLYHAPLPLFSLEASTLDNYKEARKAIYTDCVIPFFDRLIPKLNSWLMPPYGGVLDYDTDVITELHTDMQALTTALVPAWWMTGNERREAMGMEESDDPMMNTILYPNGLVPGVDLGMDQNDLSL
jgi:phage portal protein BeeE